MLHRITYSLLLILFSFSSSFPQSIKKIVVGSNTFTETQILQWAQVSPSLSVYPGLTDSIKNRLALILVTAAISIQISMVFKLNLYDSAFVNLTINFTEGEATYVKKYFY
ncbi:MAG: hypothetical protein IPH11_13740 [Ignavibacteriales bacterium]|nr:hypothetical protein [Ignavibacteriales bacterium]